MDGARGVKGNGGDGAVGVDGRQQGQQGRVVGFQAVNRLGDNRTQTKPRANGDGFLENGRVLRLLPFQAHKTFVLKDAAQSTGIMGGGLKISGANEPLQPAFLAAVQTNQPGRISF